MKPINIIQNIIFAGLICIILLFLASQFPLTGDLKLYIVRSGSMEPNIKTGSMAAVWPQSNYRVGDVITFGSDSPGNTPTTHRITSIDTGSGQTVYQTKGDANKTEDNFTVNKSTVVGKVIFSIPFLGYAIDTTRKPWGFVLVVVLPALLIIYEEVANIINQIKKMRKKPLAKKKPESVINLKIVDNG